MLSFANRIEKTLSLPKVHVLRCLNMISMIKMTNSSLNGVLVMASRIYNKSFITGSAALSTVIGLQQYSTRARNPPRTAPGSLGTLAAFTLLATNHVFADPTPPGRSMFIDAKTAQHIDAALMSPEEGFSLDQLMELAGLSVASASQDYLKRLSNDSSSSKNKRILVVCGPGNNGGDGLVAARHLKQFGHSPFVYIPFPDKNKFSSLTTQCRRAGVEVISEFPSPDEMSGYDLILDALFGFTFKGPVRDAYSPIIAAIATTNTPVLSVDIPSGWDVEKGDVYSTGFVPKAVISLTAPKLCMKGFSGLHYLGGRFLPQNFADKFGFDIPSFGDTADQHFVLNPPKEQNTVDREGWQLYTSPDGFPYYYHHESGQSEWALFQQPGAIKGGIAESLSVVIVTAPNIDVAKDIARTLVSNKLAACVQLQEKITSIYVWENALEESSEVMLFVKTRESLLPKLTDAIKLMHPYEVPEIISIDVNGGSTDYIDWVVKSTVSSSSTSGTDMN